MTNKERLRKYQEFLHLLSMGVQVGNNEMIKQLLWNADNWSYAHRVGNGENSFREQQRIIDRATEKLCNYSKEKEEMKDE